MLLLASRSSSELLCFKPLWAAQATAPVSLEEDPGSDENSSFTDTMVSASEAQVGGPAKLRPRLPVHGPLMQDVCVA